MDDILTVADLKWPEEKEETKVCLFFDTIHSKCDKREGHPRTGRGCMYERDGFCEHDKYSP